MLHQTVLILQETALAAHRLATLFHCHFRPYFVLKTMPVSDHSSFSAEANASSGRYSLLLMSSGGLYGSGLYGEKERNAFPMSHNYKSLHPHLGA